jgi:hypothetical protein
MPREFKRVKAGENPMDTTPQKAVVARAVVIGIAQAALWIVLCVALLTSVPQSEDFFKKLNASLPEATKKAITLSHFAFAYWYLAILPICLWPMVTRGVVSTLWSNPESVVARRLWYGVTWLVPIVLLAFVVLAIALPLQNLGSALR